MTFLSPIAALVAAGLAVPSLVLLYFLKLRRRQVVISSTLLWRRAIQDMQVNAPFQKLRKNLLLLLQLLILAGLLLALARPTMRDVVRPGQQMVIVIDQSASMNATDISPSRLARARDVALGLIESVGDSAAGGGAMVVSFAHRAQVVQPFTTDRALLRRAVRSIEPTDQLSRLDAALDLLAPFAARAAGAGAASDQPLAVYILSDGRATGTRDLALRGSELHFERLGTAEARNLAITALSARRDFDDPERLQVYGRLTNFGADPVDANVELKIDGSSRRVLAVTVPGAAAGHGEAGSQSVQFDFVLPGAALVEVSHDRTDHLPADDHAGLVVAPPRRLRVLLVTPGNAFLDEALQAAGARRVVRMTPKRYEDQDPQLLRRGGWEGSDAGREGFDVIVFDRYSPTEAPLVSSLSFAAAPPVPELELLPMREGAPPAQYVLDWQREHPIMRYVALDDLVMLEPGRLALPDAAQALAVGPTGPVIALVEDEGVRHVMTSFELFASNWPLQVSFPVFVQNAITWLGLGGQTEAGLSFAPGQVAVIPTPKLEQAMRYAGPVALASDGRRGRAVLPVFRRAGVYRAESPVDAPWDRLCVNLTHEVESDLRPAAQLEVGVAAVAPQGESASVRREVWTWFVWAALAVLMVEWFVYTRRMHV